ncbi:MAG: hypothetical protein ACREO5_00815 [Candidatus Binatia bacterium]
MSLYFGHAQKKIGRRLPELLSVGWLKFRGWTPRMIVQFAGDPDQLVPIRFPGRSPMRFYLKNRIQKIEASSEFIEALGRRKR